MKIQAAIEKAVAGGWNDYEGNANCSWKVPHILLNPDFWRALGKTEGWDEHGTCYEYPEGAHRHRLCNAPIAMTHWKFNMHRLIDALTSGKTEEEFFDQI